jgi:hypothetical protein
LPPSRDERCQLQRFLAAKDQFRLNTRDTRQQRRARRNFLIGVVVLPSGPGFVRGRGEGGFFTSLINGVIAA